MATPTTSILFQPSASSNFQFQATFDGNTYNVLINWNYYGQRYYVNITDLSGNLIVCIALIGSPDNYPISMTKGYFTTSLVFYESNNTFVVSG